MEKFIHKYTLGVAGFVSGLVAVTIDGEVAYSCSILLHFACSSPRSLIFNLAVFTIWAAIRALRCILPDIPFGSVIGMVVAAPFILPPYVFAPDELHPTYAKFLLIHGGQSKEVVKVEAVLLNLSGSL